MFQEIKPTMIEALKPKQSLKTAELQDGDIICFQRTTEKKGDRNILEKKLGLGEKQFPADET
jgi:ubiquitin carboxyl-terminal hydrolase 7